jgi:hypothetical protein
MAAPLSIATKSRILRSLFPRQGTGLHAPWFQLDGEVRANIEAAAKPVKSAVGEGEIIVTNPDFGPFAVSRSEWSLSASICSISTGRISARVRS